MKSIVIFNGLNDEKGFGIDESDLKRIVHPRYVAEKKYTSPEIIGAILLNPFVSTSEEGFFLDSLDRLTKRLNLEMNLERFENESYKDRWDSVRV